MLKRPSYFASAIILGACLPAGGTAWAAEPLNADQLLLVYNQRDPESTGLAEYYAKARHVPPAHLCPLAIESTADEISRADFERLIRDPIRAYLTKRGLRDQVRCLVTFYGLPIRVGPAPARPDAGPLRAKWQAEFTEGLRVFEALIRELQTIAAPSIPTSMPASRPAEDDLNRYYRVYNAAKQAAYEQIQRLKQQKTDEAEARRMLSVFEQVEGAGRLLSLILPSPGPDNAVAKEQISQARMKIEVEVDAAHDLLALDPRAPERDRGREMLRRYDGLVAYLLSLRNDLARLETAETKAAVAKAQAEHQATRKQGTSPSHSLAAYAGSYEHPGYGRLVVREQGGRLELGLDNLKAPLRHFHYDVFEVDPTVGTTVLSGTASFSTNLKGEVDEVALPLEPGVKPIVFTRVKN